MISENASTEALSQLFQSSLLTEVFSRRGMEWKFIPKRVSWYEGFWERLIGVTKTVIRKTPGRASITITELQTLIVDLTWLDL